jgi:tetratricopeptide (TPR) repeat protein
VYGTASATPLDAEERLAVLRAYRQGCTAVVQRWGGALPQYDGLGLVAYFGYPQAHEDAARRAVFAGLGLVEAVAALARRAQRDWGVTLTVQVGLHTGREVVGHMELSGQGAPLALGDTQALATALRDSAPLDTVLLSQATFRLVERDVACAAVGTHLLEASADPLGVYQVLEVRTPQQRVAGTPPQGRTPFVGRAPEVGLLREAWGQATEGLGQVVVLRGEAGIGKSRLVQRVTAQFAGSGSLSLECHCSPYFQHTAFYPLVTALQQAWHVRPEDPADAQLHQVAGVLERAGLPVATQMASWAALLGLPLPAHYPPGPPSPQLQRQQMLDVVLAWLLTEAERQPVCVTVEDGHWADASTLEWLTLLLDQVPTARLLVLLVGRPEFSLPWTARAHLTPLSLRRLSRPHVEAMVAQLTGHTRLPAEVLEYLVATTDGVPLFVEELTRLVLESGLVKERHGHYELVGPLSALAIPATLHDALMARLDRLGAAKQVAQLGATIGREFPYALLQAVAGEEEPELQQRLAQLVEAELLYQRGSGPGATYRFKHALIQEAAYHSLLKSTRQQVHQQIAQVLAARFPESVETQPALLAHHALHGAIWEKALLYFRQAGAKAMQQSAYQEAVTCFEQALVALQHLPECRATQEQAIDLRLDLRTPLFVLWKAEQLLDHLQAAAALAEALDDPHRLGRVSLYMMIQLHMLGEHDRAITSGQHALDTAMVVGDVALHAVAQAYLGSVYHARCDYRRAIDFCQQTVVLLDGPLLHERFGQAFLPSVHARATLAWCLAEVGRFVEGMRIGAEGLRIAEAVGHPNSLAFAYFGIGCVLLQQGDFPKAISVLERALGICQDIGLTLLFLWIGTPLGRAYALSGRIDEALRLLEQVVERATSMGVMVLQALRVTWLGEAHLLAGRVEAAHTLAEHALACARGRQERGHEAYALRLLGEIAARRAPHALDHAASHYQQALALATELGMRPLQAHCHHGLSTLYRQMGRVEQARAVLSTAIDLYGDMGRTFWLPAAEAALAQVEAH